MKVSEAVTAWVGAAALTIAFFLVPPTWYAPPRPVPHADIVVIGSSLMAYAVPVRGEGRTSLLGDGRSHVRLAQPSITERQTLDFVDEALGTRPAVMFVEINALFLDLAHRTRRRPCDGWYYPVLAMLEGRRERVVDVYQKLRGRQAWLFFADDPPDLYSRQRITPEAVWRSYPILVRSPCEGPRLGALVRRAKAQNTRLVFVLPPRSPFADVIVGHREELEILSSATTLADGLGVGLFSAGTGWRNSQFVDHAHLNAVGRRRFIAELQKWWARSQ